MTVVTLIHLVVDVREIHAHHTIYETTPVCVSLFDEFTVKEFIPDFSLSSFNQLGPHSVQRNIMTEQMREI